MTEDRGQLPVERYLVLGDASCQYPIVPTRVVPVVVMRLQDGVGPAAVDLVSADAVIAGSEVRVRWGPTTEEVRVASGLTAWAGTRLDRLTGAALAREILDVDSLERLMPLMVIRVHRPAGRAEVMACSRLRGSGALFTRVGELPLTPEVEGELPLESALKVIAEPRPHVLTDFHQCTSLTGDVEVETKLALSGTRSAWALASHLSGLVGTAEMPGFIPDLGNEVQRWQSAQSTWEVVGPVNEAGYLALLDFGTGQHAIKRKRFREDGLRREETFRFDVTLPAEGLDDYISSLYPDLELRRLPSHRRSKFDVNVESVRTGHFFGIEVDEVQLEESSHGMSQLEIEYHRSRTHHGLDPAELEPELFRLTDLVRAILTRLGEEARPTTYSKLSFLRDVHDRGTSEYGYHRALDGAGSR